MGSGRVNEGLRADCEHQLALIQEECGFHFPACRVAYDRGSSLYSPRGPVHDTCQNAAYVFNTLKQAEQSATSMSYWALTDVFEEVGPLPAFHSGFELLRL